MWGEIFQTICSCLVDKFWKYIYYSFKLNIGSKRNAFSFLHSFPLLCALSRDGQNSMSFLCQTSVLALRSSTGFLKVRGLATNITMQWRALLCCTYGNEKWNLWVLWSITSLIYTTPDKAWPGQLSICISMQCVSIWPLLHLSAFLYVCVFFCSVHTHYLVQTESVDLFLQFSAVIRMKICRI